MTVLQMHDLLDKKLGEYPGFESYEWNLDIDDKDHWLTQAQRMYTEQLFKVDKTQLNGLVEYKEVGLETNFRNNRNAFIFPANSDTYVGVLDIKVGDKKIQEVLLHSIIEILRKEDPYLPSPYYATDRNKVIVAKDPYSKINKIEIGYIKYPLKLRSFKETLEDTDMCQLPERYHIEIVRLAVKLIIEMLESRKISIIL